MRSNLVVPIISAVLLGVVSLAIVLFLVTRGVQKPQNAVQSHAAGTTTDVTKCQGNANPDARCYDCKKDTSTTSQINIVDFGCFNQWYGKNVGTQ